jgi:amidohydrolase
MSESTTATVCNDESEYVIVDSLRIRRGVYCIKDEVVANRRGFHKKPELSFREFETTKKIAEELRKYGTDEVYDQIHEVVIKPEVSCASSEVQEVKGWTGVIALIRGEKSGPCVALRADIDANSVQEIKVNDTDKDGYFSEVAGVMHACGHDGHTAGLLAAAKVLNGMKSKFSGVIKLIFQPAEEDGGGARVLIDDYDCLGLKENSKYGPKVDYIFGLHIVSGKMLLILIFLVCPVCLMLIFS